MAYHNYYAGGHVTGWDSAGIPRGIYTWRGNGYDIIDRAALAADLDTFLNWLVAPRLPLYIGEYGIHKDARNGSQWLTHMVSALNARYLPRSYWEWHGAGPWALADPNWAWSPYTDIVAKYS